MNKKREKGRIIRYCIPQMLMGASSSRRTGWARKTCLAARQRFLISASVSWIRFPLLFLPSNNLCIIPSNPSIRSKRRFLHSSCSFVSFLLILMVGSCYLVIVSSFLIHRTCWHCNPRNEYRKNSEKWKTGSHVWFMCVFLISWYMKTESHHLERGRERDCRRSGGVEIFLEVGWKRGRRFVAEYRKFWPFLVFCSWAHEAQLLPTNGFPSEE